MRIVTLRASRTSLTAEVVVGTADNGTAVTSTVKLDRIKNDELAKAMAPLENIVLREVNERWGQARDNAAFRAAVRERSDKEIAAEKERLGQASEQRLRSLQADLQRAHDASEQHLKAQQRIAAERDELYRSRADLERRLQELLTEGQE